MGAETGITENWEYVHHIRLTDADTNADSKITTHFPFPVGPVNATNGLATRDSSTDVSFVRNWTTIIHYNNPRKRNVHAPIKLKLFLTTTPRTGR